MIVICILGLVIVLLAFLIYARKKTVEGFGEFFDIQKGFGDDQTTLFHDSEGKAI